MSEHNLSAGPAGSMPAGPAAVSGAGTGLCVLLACFPGAKRAGKIRRDLDQRIRRGADKILDQVVLQVDARQRVHIYDPHKTLAGTLTTALTWGIFGLLGGGVKSGGFWAILGAIGGGLFAYFVAGHPFPKDELKRIGGHQPSDSSAIMAFIQGSDGQQILSTAAPAKPAAASVAMIGADLSARVLAADTEPAQAPSAAAESGSAAGSAASVLNMLLLRYPGSGTARHKLAKARSAHPKDGGPVHAELLFEAPEHGRLKVSDPTRGPAAAAKSNVAVWGLFGVVYGLIVGLTSHSGILSHVTSGVVNGLVWAVFGAIAGALYGLWVMRAVSARQMKGMRPLLPPGTSTVLAWSEGNLNQQDIEEWSAPGLQRLILRFKPASDGMRLEA